MENEWKGRINERNERNRWGNKIRNRKKDRWGNMCEGKIDLEWGWKDGRRKGRNWRKGWKFKEIRRE